MNLSSCSCFIAPTWGNSWKQGSLHRREKAPSRGKSILLVQFGIRSHALQSLFPLVLREWGGRYFVIFHNSHSELLMPKGVYGNLSHSKLLVPWGNSLLEKPQIKNRESPPCPPILYRFSINLVKIGERSGDFCRENENWFQSSVRDSLQFKYVIALRGAF